MNSTSSHQHPATDTGRNPTADEARAALEQASTRRLTGQRDRRIYGQALALIGLAMGAFTTLSQGFTPSASAWLPSSVLAAIYVLVILGIGAWQRRKASSIPRGAKRAGYLGLGVTVVVMMVVIGALNWRGQNAPNPGWELLLGAAAVAAPLGVTGLLIGRGRS